MKPVEYMKKYKDFARMTPMLELEFITDLAIDLNEMLSAKRKQAFGKFVSPAAKRAVFDQFDAKVAAIAKRAGFNDNRALFYRNQTFKKLAEAQEFASKRMQKDAEREDGSEGEKVHTG